MLLVYLLASVPPLEAVESFLGTGVQWIRFVAELISILIITIGIIVTIYGILRSYSLSGSKAYNVIRFTFSRYLVMALEFELAADIMGTAISPTWDQLGKLAVIATIRTFLSYFLGLEIKEEKKELAERQVNTGPGGEA